MTDIQKHLSKVETDQILNGIASLNRSLRNQDSRHWAVSQMNQPVLAQGEYNSFTGRYQACCGQQRATVVTTIVVATSVITCPAGHKYKISLLSAVEAGFTATSYALSAVLGGNTIAVLPDGGNQLAGQAALLIGSPVHVNGAGTLEPSLMSLELNEGDTLTITMSDWGAGDTWTLNYIFEDIVI